MKVADGFWLSKKGYEVNYASQAIRVETTENRPLKFLQHLILLMNRGMTLGGPNLEVTYLLPVKTQLRFILIITEAVLITFLVLN